MVQKNITSDICLFDFNKCYIDLSRIENRRFMYHPTGLLLLGKEDVVNTKGLFKSHADEHWEAEECFNIKLPSYDEFIKGWIGVSKSGKQYEYGIIHFAPNIPEGHVELFEIAFAFVEAVLKNGFSEKTVLRGFPGKWEQTIGEMMGIENTLDKQIQQAQSQSVNQKGKVCEIKQREL